MSRIRQCLAHAFAVGPDPQVEARIPESMERLCELIAARRLETVAIIALESIVPIARLLSQPLYGIIPLAKLAGLDESQVAELASGLEDRRMPRLLVERLSDLARRRDLP